MDWSDLGDLSYSKAIEKLHKNYRTYERAEELFKDLRFGNGGFEVWFEKIGKKITSSDVNKLSDDAIGSLLSNIFYNDVPLLKLISEPILKLLIEKISNNSNIVEFLKDDMKKYRGPRKQMKVYIDSL